MGSTEPARPSEQPGMQAVTARRLAVVLGGPADADRIYRVDSPDRVLRIWALLNNADDELHQMRLPSGAAVRLRRQLDAVTAELERSVSPALVGELHNFIRHGDAATATADELRVEYASLLGWTGGLVIGILSQLETAAADAAAPALAPTS